MDIEKKLDKEISILFKSLGENGIVGLGNRSLTYRQFLSDKMLVISVIKRGVPYSLFGLIKNTAPFSDVDWAGFLHISTKSLHRFKQDSRSFKPLQSEKIIEMAEVINLGKEVFGDMKKFKLWLDTPNFSFRNLKPIELLKDSYGKELVVGELTRIDYGILV